jgi:flavodoxin
MSSKKYLVAYFSLAGDNYKVGVVKIGNTKLLAGHIAKYLNADEFEIEGDNKYPEKYMDRVKQANKEKSQNLRPKLVRQIDNFSQYDTVFLGYPIWYGRPPMAFYTFLETYDFSNKNVYLFCTHEGSGQSGTFAHIKGLLPKANVSTNGLVMQGAHARTPGAKQEVESWIQKLKC